MVCGVWCGVCGGVWGMWCVVWGVVWCVWCGVVCVVWCGVVCVGLRVAVVCSGRWRVSDVNSRFQLSGTYPSQLVVPAHVSDGTPPVSLRVGILVFTCAVVWCAVAVVCCGVLWLCCAVVWCAVLCCGCAVLWCGVLCCADRKSVV